MSALSFYKNLLRLSLLLSFGQHGMGVLSAQEEEPPIQFTYSIHSTLGTLELETEGEGPELVKQWVPNRGFSKVRKYVGLGPLRYRLLSKDGSSSVQELPVPRQWQGRHIYLFVVRGAGDTETVKLMPIPENPGFSGKGAIVFANFSAANIAAKMDEIVLRAAPGQIYWESSIEAPSGMETILVQSVDDGYRPIYRNRIPVRANERVFIFIVPSKARMGMELLVVFDRAQPRRIVSDDASSLSGGI
ncbi:hypothetical protein H5P28_04200 [Ruficoccus amylovorans]|uniref:Uncharacterized protein n=1 Tax=Ruficoccus amylovorans TaxID=1804625 RepID=A0A842HCN8_9BACT|nr:hypothetical protein [Ruficoccus amylovorans]MBC2593456.1 hypothetical protein [Ruficoccus amylovorans]